MQLGNVMGAPLTNPLLTLDKSSMHTLLTDWGNIVPPTMVLTSDVNPWLNGPLLRLTATLSVPFTGGSCIFQDAFGPIYGSAAFASGVAFLDVPGPISPSTIQFVALSSSPSVTSNLLSVAVTPTVYSDDAVSAYATLSANGSFPGDTITRDFLGGFAYPVSTEYDSIGSHGGVAVSSQDDGFSLGHRFLDFQINTFGPGAAHAIYFRDNSTPNNLFSPSNGYSNPIGTYVYDSVSNWGSMPLPPSLGLTTLTVTGS